MSLKREDILLTKFDIEILDFLQKEKKSIKKTDLYSHFQNKENNRINDRIQNLYNLKVIDETNRDKKKGKEIKILNSLCVNFILKFFPISNTH